MTVTINGQKYTANDGDTILKCATDNGIFIPTLCFLEGVNDVAACRICMVEVEGFERLLAACNTKVFDGMVITTESEKLDSYRKEMTRLLFARHDIKLPVKDDNPYISYDPEKCVHCQRCISICHKIVVNKTLKNGRLGNHYILEAPFGPDYKDTGCESCGNCASVCRIYS